MAASNINVIALTGNLTRDPEIRSTQGGMSICTLRVACNSRAKAASGEWEDKPNYFNVTVFGATADNCAKFLEKGRPVAVSGRLAWREWDDKQGAHRESVEIVAEAVQFLSSGDGAGRSEPDTSGEPEF